jgi:hypothetical protein
MRRRGFLMMVRGEILVEADTLVVQLGDSALWKRRKNNDSG